MAICKECRNDLSYLNLKAISWYDLKGVHFIYVAILHTHPDSYLHLEMHV